MKNEMSLDGYQTNELTQLELINTDGGTDRHYDGTIKILGLKVYDGERAKGDRWIWQW
jgi:hypothetical protein